ncbi:hypothetical protein JW835_09505 [bacterium]|nr:hypothetical protein [bacterium]
MYAVRVFNVNDYSSIQNAIDAAVQQNTGLTIIYFPVGTYYINTPIILNQNSNPLLDGSNILFQGEGSDRTFLKFTVGNNNPCFKFSGKVDPSINEQVINADIPKKAKRILCNNVFTNNDCIHFYEFNFDDSYQGGNKKYVGQINRIASSYNNSGYDLVYEASKDYSQSMLKIVRILRIWRYN